MRFFSILALFIFGAIQANAQVFSNKEVGKKNEALADSLKKSEYPYILPIWGDKVTKKGFNLPYSAGLGIYYFWQESDLTIDNLNVGFNNGPTYNLDEIVRFKKATATASAYTVRPDVWLFPFLNVYGILGQTSASTEISAGVYLPDSTDQFSEVFELNSKVDFKATTFGIGMTPTIGIGGGFLALDMNCAWTDVPQLSKPTFTFIFGPRIGKNFKLKKPGRAIAIWTGGFRVHLNSATNGSINLNEVVDIPAMQEKVDIGLMSVAEKQENVDTWWGGLTQMQQNNPVNIAKHDGANAVLNKAGEVLYAADVALNDGEHSTVQYSMDKRPTNKWNYIIGSQFEFSKRWLVRVEYGFLGSRTQLVTGLQYRFGL